MAAQEIRVRCTKTFKLQELVGLKRKDTNVEIRERNSGLAIKHVLEGGQRFYEVEMVGHMFSMTQKSFDEHMEERQLHNSIVLDS